MIRNQQLFKKIHAACDCTSSHLQPLPNRQFSNRYFRRVAINLFIIKIYLRTVTHSKTSPGNCSSSISKVWSGAEGWRSPRRYLRELLENSHTPCPSLFYNNNTVQAPPFANPLKQKK